MGKPLRRPWTIEEFLEWEAEQEERYEFIDGVIYGMTGGTNAHTIIKGNVFAALRAKLRTGRCRVLTDGCKIVTADDSFYPDAVVTCAPIAPADDRIAEPAVIVEVLSRSTADRDRAWKWTAYQELPSLRHYVPVSQQERRVDIYSREGEAWRFESHQPPRSAVPLTGIDVELTLEEIYEDSGA